MTKNLPLLIALFLAVSCSAPTSAPEAEPSERESERATAAIQMSIEAQSHTGLQVTTAQVQLLKEYLSVTGTVQPIDSQTAHVRLLGRGILATVSVKIGDRVATGQTLATYDNMEAGEFVSQYRTALAELEKAKVELSVARQQTERNRQLADIGAIPRKEYELSLGEERSIAASIKAHETVVGGLLARLQRFGLNEGNLAGSLAPTIVRAPFAGIVIRADAAPGEIIGPETEIFQIADLSRVWVQAEVYEKDLGRIQLGQSASVVVDTYPDREFSGQVNYISDAMDRQTRTAKVRCEVANPKGLLKIDMFTTVRLPTTFSKEALVIPVESIQQIDGSNVVFVRRGGTTFEQKPVEIGRSVQGSAEVLSGLSAGEAVVTKGAFHLKSIALGEEIGEEH